MAKINKKGISTETIVTAAVMTALVIILQMMGAFIRFGPFQICLVLVPIVIGASTCGIAVGAWLGLVFGIVVLANGDAAPFMAVHASGTVFTVLSKGVFCGLAAGGVYSLLKKYNKYLAVVSAAVVCPLVNTGVFLLGCRLFFMDTITQWGVAAGMDNVVQYMVVGLVGFNFLFEMGSNILLSPVIVRILNIRKRI